MGFDLYLRLVGEAVADYRGEDTEPEPEVRIELPVEAHLPPDYVESERLRLEMYKRLASVREASELDALRDELLDRYGTPPPAVEALLAVARFRLLCRSVGLTEVIAAGNMIRLAPADLPDSRVMRMNRLYPGAQLRKALGQVLLPRPLTRPITGTPLKDAELLAWATQAVEALFGGGTPGGPSSASR